MYITYICTQYYIYIIPKYCTKELRQQCEQFAVDLLRQTRNSQELDVILKHDSENAPSIGSMNFRLIELAIKYKQKHVSLLTTYF